MLSLALAPQVQIVLEHFNIENYAVLRTERDLPDKG
jgi:hypothetical protein